MIDIKQIKEFLSNCILKQKEGTQGIVLQFKKPFCDYDISLSVLCADIKKKYAFKITPVDIYAYPTIERLAEYLEAQLSYKSIAKPTFLDGQSHQQTVCKEPTAIVGMPDLNSREDYCQQINIKHLPYLADYVVFGQPVFPVAAIADMLLAHCTTADHPQTIQHLSIERALLISEKNDVSLCTKIHTTDDQQTQVHGYISNTDTTRQDAQWQLMFNAELGAPSNKAIPAMNIQHLKKQLQEQPTEQLYEKFNALGLHYGTAFQTIKTVHCNDHAALVSLETTLDVSHTILHPTLFDGALQALVGILAPLQKDHTYLPVSMSNVVLHAAHKQSFTDVYAYIALLENRDPELIQGRIYFCDNNGNVLISIDKVQAKRTNAASLMRSLQVTEQGAVADLNQSRYITQWQRLEHETNKAELIGHWLLINDDPSISRQIRTAFKSVEAELSILSPPTDSFSRKELEKCLNSKTNPLAGVLYLPKVRQSISAINSNRLLKDQQNGIEGLLALLKLWPSDINAPIYLLTYNAQPITGHSIDLTHSPLIGLRRSIVIEQPTLKIKHIDLDHDNPHWVQNVLDSIAENNTEDEIAYRGNDCFVPRLKRYESQRLILPEQRYRLIKSDSSLINDISLQSEAETSLNPTQVEVEVKTIGLNFRDVLNVMNLYPGDPGPLGLDAAGIITRVGEQVKALKVGDAVLGLMPGACASHVLTQPELLTNLPEGMSFDTAASIPTVYMTVYLALQELAQLKKGEKVLIHAATGGVGQAAIEIAQHIGAEIYVTVGSQEKRDHLIAQGITHIYSSRDIDYATQILNDTDGKGVDVVLNSLTKEGFIEATLKACTKKARFCEIGKHSIWTPAQMRKARIDIAYHVIALDHIAETKPANIQYLLNKVMQHFAQGHYQGMQTKTFLMQNAKSAFTYMQQAKHIGKVVVSTAHQLFDKDKTYIITGGLGGLGLRLADWLIKQGVQHLVLAGRHQPDAEQSKRLETFRKHADVETKVLDVSDANAVNQCVGRYQKTLKGIFHAAGVMDDGILAEQNWHKFETVFAPKILGALNLYQACEKYDITLDYFVNYSAIASALGSAGQSNYAAANSFLDSFSAYCRVHHQAGQTIQWGNWSEVGMSKALVGKYKARGWLAMRPGFALMALQDALNEPADLMIAKMDWSKLLAQSKTTPRLVDFSQSATAGKLQDQLNSIHRGLPQNIHYHALQTVVLN